MYNEIADLLVKSDVKKFACKGKVTCLPVISFLPFARNTVSLNSQLSMQLVERKYVFPSEEIPAEGTYCKISYSAAYPKLDEDLSGKTFSKGTSSSCRDTCLLFSLNICDI
jgi:hypothetical protein